MWKQGSTVIQDDLIFTGFWFLRPVSCSQVSHTQTQNCGGHFHPRTKEVSTDGKKTQKLTSGYALKGFRFSLSPLK